MTVSVFDLLTIGIGPSSSHTVGPMRAARDFVDGLRRSGTLALTARVRVELLGSLGATGRGHGSDDAVLLGLLGERPETCEPRTARALVAAARGTRRLRLAGAHDVNFDLSADLVLDGNRTLPAHPNAMTFDALDALGTVLAHQVSYSVGGGFVVTEGAATDAAEPTELPHPFRTAADLLEIVERTGMTIAEVAFANEQARLPAVEVRSGLLHIADVMRESIDRGLSTEGVLPGGLGVPRRAPRLARLLTADSAVNDPMRGSDWLTLFAMAVNEQNAAGERVVTAPTNGAAGILPAVLEYHRRFHPAASDDTIVNFLLTAGAIGSIYKETASISGAAVGCQGEVGSACSMAAGAFAAVSGGTPGQVENAAEIGMEHNLGLTCDPIGGLVQIPCIERNGLAAVKAVTAARTALRGDGTHIVSLDEVIATMRQTGFDMKSRYKETSRGGLATLTRAASRVSVDIVEC